MIYKIGISALFAVSMTISTTAIANDFSFTGAFSADDEVQLFDFTVDAPSIITLRTYSYAGGVLASGDVVSPGGFDPILALYDSEGNLVTTNDDGITGTVPFDPNTGEAFDTALETVLDAGDYTVAVMQYNNHATGPTLADGFNQSGGPFFTSRFNCSNGQFCDASNEPVYNNRTNEWAFDVLNVESATLVGPEPGPAPGPAPEPEPDCKFYCDGSKKHDRGDHAKRKRISRCSLGTHYDRSDDGDRDRRHHRHHRHERSDDYDRHDRHRRHERYDDDDRHHRYNRSDDSEHHDRFR